MVKDALKAYLQLASGLTEVTRERAMSAAQALVNQAGALSRNPKDSSAQVRALADELAKSARDNRDLVVGMVRAETERAVSAVGAASVDDLVALRRRVDALQTQLDELAGGAGPAAATKAADTPARSASPKKAATKKSATKRSATEESASEKAATKKSGGPTSATTNVAAKSSRRLPGSPADAVTPTPAEASTT